MIKRVALLGMVASTFVFAQDSIVDFRYSPASYFATICFPNDWQKTVVTQNGTIGDDFGPGPYAVPLTEIGIGISSDKLVLRNQHLEGARIPILESEFSGGGTTLRQYIFAIPPVRAYRTPLLARGKVTRVEGLNGVTAWASPKGKADPAFRNAAWGVNRPIRYSVKTVPGARKLVALGFCEPYKRGPGTRTFVIRVEGAPAMNFDPMTDAEKNLPRVVLIHGQDANNDGQLSIEVHSALESPDPNVFLNVFWIFPDTATWSVEQILRGDASSSAELYYPCGPENDMFGPNVRFDGILADLEGSHATPVVRIKTSRNLSLESGTGVVLSDGHPYLMTRPRGVSLTFENAEWHLTLPGGTKRVEVFLVHGRPADTSSPAIPDLNRALEAARAYWHHEPPLPYDRIQVPDQQMQFLLDANIRTLYQDRERVDSALQFQPGPSVYRGLWVHDDVWYVSVALMLGDTASALEAIDAIAKYQETNGQVKVLTPTIMVRETPLFIYHLLRYAEVTGDTAWLSRRWWRIERGFEWLNSQRIQTMADPNSVSFGLLPAGFADGGLGGMHPEYSSVYWSLVALRKASAAARRMGMNADARKWEKLHDDLLSSFRTAARRDIRRDTHGNIYLPVMVGDTSASTPPQRAQWGLLEAQVYGNLFGTDDSLVTGTLAMLDASTIEGLPLNTGWLKDGVWPFFAGFYGIAHLREGDTRRAEDILYAFANHANPLGTWVEEQLPRTMGTRTTGDGSDASASAQFIMLLSNLLQFEHDSTLGLLEGLPDSWLRPDASLALNDIWTRFGRVTLSLKVSPDGRQLDINVGPIDGDGRSGGPILSLGALRRRGFKQKDGRPLPDEIVRRWGEQIHVSARRD